MERLGLVPKSHKHFFSLPMGMESAGQGRWCRLRGNLLFYQKSAEAWSEPAGVLVLDVGDIRPDPPRQDRLWAFTLGLRLSSSLFINKLKISSIHHCGDGTEVEL